MSLQTYKVTLGGLSVIIDAHDSQEARNAFIDMYAPNADEWASIQVQKERILPDGPVDDYSDDLS